MHRWFHIVCDLITLQGGSCQCQDTPCWYQCAPCNWQGACNYYHHCHDGVWWCFVVYQTITSLCKKIPKHNTNIISLPLLLLHKFSHDDFFCLDYYDIMQIYNIYEENWHDHNRCEVNIQVPDMSWRKSRFFFFFFFEAWLIGNPFNHHYLTWHDDSTLCGFYVTKYSSPCQVDNLVWWSRMTWLISLKSSFYLTWLMYNTLCTFDLTCWLIQSCGVNNWWYIDHWFLLPNFQADKVTATYDVVSSQHGGCNHAMSTIGNK